MAAERQYTASLPSTRLTCWLCVALCTKERREHTVLRISLVEAPDETVTLRLAGGVSGPWVEELRRWCEQVLAARSGLSLDLADVSFVDLDGVALCRSLSDRKVMFLHCSPFVAEQLKG